MFSWLPIYQELAIKLLEYHSRQSELLILLKEMDSAGLAIFSLKDKNEEGKEIELTVMDPFTFFAVFNRGITEENRKAILSFIKNRLNLTAEVPDDFYGIPVMSNFNAWFFSHEKDRNDDDIGSLWDLAKSLITEGVPDKDTFNICLKIRNMGLPKLSVGIFWMTPTKMLPYDANTQKYLEDHGIHIKTRNFDGYFDLLDKVKNIFNKEYYMISADAYIHSSDHKLHNGLIAKVLNEDRNAPFDLWQERVEQMLMPVFKDLDAMIQESGCSLEKGKRYRRTTKDKAKEHTRLFGFQWKFENTDPSFGNNKIEFQVVFGEYRKNMEKTVWWGINWWGKATYADSVDEFISSLNTEGKLILKDSDELFGGTCVRILLKKYSKEEIEKLDHDIKLEIVEDCINIMEEANKALKIKAKNEMIAPNDNDFSINDILSELFMDEKTFFEILAALSYRKNIIIQGPPGVGKTFVAKRLAYAEMGKKDESRVEMIQFHQSYAYEDFIQGYRPIEDGGFELKNGVFYEFVKRAQHDTDSPYFFIIDEINRANLGKVFGELMMLIEADKRGPEFALPLAYAKNAEDRFYIPKNVHLIGTMNTADRSITIVDYALRRRFAFFGLKPEFGDKFAAHLSTFGVDSDVLDQIISRIAELNSVITADKKNLGPDFEIGHSFFCPLESVEDVTQWYNRIIKLEIKPQLLEYWFDDPEKAEQQVSLLYI